jgi:hypothetical protein
MITLAVSNTGASWRVRIAIRRAQLHRIFGTIRTEQWSGADATRLNVFSRAPLCYKGQFFVQLQDMHAEIGSFSHALMPFAPDGDWQVAGIAFATVQFLVERTVVDT